MSDVMDENKENISKIHVKVHPSADCVVGWTICKNLGLDDLGSVPVL